FSLYSSRPRYVVCCFSFTFYIFATTALFILSLHDALPIFFNGLGTQTSLLYRGELFLRGFDKAVRLHLQEELDKRGVDLQFNSEDRKSTRLNSSHVKISYAVFCLK